MSMECSNPLYSFAKKRGALEKEVLYLGAVKGNVDNYPLVLAPFHRMGREETAKKKKGPGKLEER